jgi:2-methylcitrate dehydratase PrpD
VVPAAIAAAETVGATGERLVLGIVAGYEMMERLGFALGHEHNNRGYHTTGVAGPIAACVAAAVVAGADESVVARGIGIACSSASGIKAFTDGSGGMVKRLHAGHAAEQGVLAWQLASRGFTGPLQAIDGRYGLLEVIGGTGAHPAALDARLGETWAVDHVWVKTFPCCGLIHTTAQAVSEIRDAEKLDAAEVESVRLGLGQRAVDQNGATDPQDPMAAQYSIPYCAAVALTGDVRDPRSFLGAALEDPAPRAMIQRITLYVDDEVERHFPGRFGVKAELRTRDGRRFGKTLWYARGTPFDACSEEDILAKFRRLAGAVAAPGAVSAVERAIVAIAEAKDVTGLSAALRAATLADARS